MFGSCGETESKLPKNKLTRARQEAVIQDETFPDFTFSACLEIHNSEQTQECFCKRALKQHLERGRKLFDTNIIFGRMYTTG